jgi:hypothetical protein
MAAETLSSAVSNADGGGISIENDSILRISKTNTVDITDIGFLSTYDTTKYTGFY